MYSMIDGYIYIFYHPNLCKIFFDIYLNVYKISWQYTLNNKWFNRSVTGNAFYFYFIRKTNTKDKKYLKIFVLQSFSMHNKPFQHNEFMCVGWHYPQANS